MATKYPNLAAEIVRHGFSNEEIYTATAEAVKKTPDTVSNWIGGRAGELPITAAFVIRNKFFPNMTVDYLFDTQPIT